MHLVDKEGGAPAVQGALLLCFGGNLAQLLDSGQNGVDAHKARTSGVGDDHGQGGLASARGTVEDDRGELIRLDGATKQPAWTQDVALSDELFQGTRTHPRSQRRLAVDLLLPRVGEKVLLCHP